MVTVVTDKIDVWTSALQNKSTAGRNGNSKQEAYGMMKLRELILELAVRGRLVLQDSDDEPANVLLERIADEKVRLTNGGTIKTRKSLPLISHLEGPFPLPVGWQWSRLQDITTYIQRGKSPIYADSGRVQVVSQKCVQRSGFDLSQARYVDDTSLESYQLERYLKADDLLWNSTGTGTVGRICVVPTASATGLVADSHVTVIRPQLVNSKFLWCYISAPGIQQRIEPGHEKSLVSGTTNQVELNLSEVVSLIVPVPPLAEQRRIVVKVDELMALCDQLEQQYTSSIDAHEILVETLLVALTRGESKAEHIGAWTRVTNQFDTLFTTEHSVRQLKRTILQLAVTGKLVRQDHNEEPARILVQRLAERRERMIEEGRLKGGINSPLAAREREGLLPLPAGWVWSRLPEIGELARGKSKHRPRNDPKLYANGTTPMVQTGDVSRANPFITTHTALYNQNGVDQSRIWPKGTMCITIAANIAETGILAFDACFPDSVVGFIPFDESLNVKYFEYFIRTAKDRLEDYAPSTAQKNINLEILGQLLVPLPPAGELERIVAKIDDLMALCDALSRRLNDAQSIQNHLADAIVEQAVA